MRRIVFLCGLSLPPQREPTLAPSGRGLRMKPDITCCQAAIRALQIRSRFAKVCRTFVQTGIILQVNSNGTINREDRR